jgi:hypothetical protein
MLVIIITYILLKQNTVQKDGDCIRQPTGFLLLSLLTPPDVYARHPLQRLQCYLDYAELVTTVTERAGLHIHFMHISKLSLT